MKYGEAGKLRIGTKVECSLPGGKSVTGRIMRMRPNPDCSAGFEVSISHFSDDWVNARWCVPVLDKKESTRVANV